MGFPAVPDDVEVLTVGAITRDVQRLIEDTFRRVWVTGEVSNAKRHSSGHIYLTLKDSEASLKAVIWRSVAMRLRFEPRDGMEIIARGRLSVYPPQGVYQFNIEELQPKGIGAQELALRQLREKLFKLGYFAPERKKPLPRYPRRIALVTSATGAAVRDMLEILVRRWPIAEFWVCPVRVQGDGAAESIAGAVAHLNHMHRGGGLSLDVIILGRGGGSSEDLWAFNEECLAHAIFRSIVPIVSAVGHEIDITTADMVADVRALTPSQAATMVTPDRAEVLAGLTDLEARLRMGLIELVEHRRRRLNELAGRPAFRMPLERVRAEEQRLDNWSERLSRATRQRVARAREKLEACAGQLESLSPLNVLARGYSLTRKEADRVVVRDPLQVQPGDRLVSTVEHGQIISRVEETHPTTDASASSQGRPSATRMQQA